MCVTMKTQTVVGAAYAAKLCHGIEYVLSASYREERRHKKAVEEREKKREQREALE